MSVVHGDTGWNPNIIQVCWLSMSAVHGYTGWNQNIIWVFILRYMSVAHSDAGWYQKYYKYIMIL